MQRVAVATLGRAVCLTARRMVSATRGRSGHLHNSWQQAPIAVRQFHFSRPVAAAAGEVGVSKRGLVGRCKEMNCLRVVLDGL